MPLLKSPLLRVRVIASRIVHPRAARERQRRETIPCWAGERRVDLHPLPSKSNRQVSVNVYEPVLGNGRRDGGAEQFTRASTVQRVDTVDDGGLGIRKALGEDAGEETVLGGACTAPLAEHPVNRAVARAPVGNCADGLHQVEQRGVGSDHEPVDDSRGVRIARGRESTSELGAGRRISYGPMPGPPAELGARIYKCARLTGEFRLRSGAVSEEYFDKYLFESDPHLLREIAEELVGLLPAGVEVLAGLELGGVPLAVLASQVSGLPVVFVRKTAKTYGTCRLAEGGEIAARRVAVVEDVVTSGGQVIECCRELRARDADVSAVLCVIDREADGRENLATEGLELRSLFTMSQLRQGHPTDPNGAAHS